jgi:cholesterol oxidase
MNYTDCLHCGFCAQGCKFDKKNTLLHTYIPLAEQHGAQFRGGCQVDTIEPSTMGGRSGYLANYTENGVAKQIFGRRMFVAGGGLHTPALLLRSRRNLPNLSTHVGEHFNHNGELQFLGILPEGWGGYDLSNYECYKGMDNAGMMTFHWWESDNFTLHPGGGMEPSVFAAAIATANDPEIPKLAWGMKYKRFVESVYPHRVFGFSSLGLADSHGAVVLASDGKSPDVVDRDRTAYDAYLDVLLARVAEASARAGVKVLPGYARKYSGMTSAHLLSSCRMAERVEDGVVDQNCEVFNYPNLFICDASAIPYALGVNPALNISAVAEHTSDFVIARG